MAADREETPKDTHNSKDSSSGADEVALPPGWFATKAASGQTYYYNLLAQTTLDRPTEPLRSSKASSSTAPGSKQKAKPGSPISRTSSSDRQIETSSTMPAEQRKPADSAYGKPSGKKPIAAADVSQKPREWQPSHQGFQRLVRILKYKNPIEIMRSVKRLFRSYRFLRPYLVKTDICFKHPLLRGVKLRWYPSIKELAVRVKGKTGAKIDLFYLPQVKLLFRDVQRYFNRKRDAYGKASGYAHVASRAVDALRNTTKLDYDSRPATRQRRAALGISPLGVQVQVPDDD